MLQSEMSLIVETSCSFVIPILNQQAVRLEKGQRPEMKPILWCLTVFEDTGIEPK